MNQLTSYLAQQMASLELPESPPNPSFAIREAPDKRTKLLRSISTKQTFFSDDCSCTPPRNSTQSLHASPLRDPLATTPIHTINHEASYRCVSSVLKKDGHILSVAVSKGLLYTGSATNLIRVWKLPEFRECGQLKSRTCMVVALQVSNDRVYAAYGDGKIRVWRRVWDVPISHVRLATIPRTASNVLGYFTRRDKTNRHMAPVTSLAINVSDDILYSASLDKTVKVWRLSDFKCTETIQAHSEPINAIVMSDDGVLYTASDDATVRVWRRNFCRGNRSHSLTVTLRAKCSPVKTLTLTLVPKDGMLYGGCADGYIHYWHKGWLSGQLQYGGALQGHTHAVMCIASVANYVISGSADATSRVWAREQDGQHVCLAVLVGHRGPIRCVAAFTPQLRNDAEDPNCMICTGSLDGVLKIWRLTPINNSTTPLTPNPCDYFNLH